MLYNFSYKKAKRHLSDNKAFYLQLFFVIILFPKAGIAQSFMEDLFKGKMLSSEPGVWAIYEITDKSSKTQILLRQAITGIEKIDENTTALWLESEIIPTEGFPSVYRFLISYDKNGKEKIHKIVVREGANPPQNIDNETTSENTETTSKKKLIGEEDIEFKNGKIKAKHYRIDGDNATKEIWLNDEVKPLGIVKLSTNEGEMILVKYGKGGEESKSAIALPVKKDAQQNVTKPHVDVSTTEPQKNE